MEHGIASKLDLLETALGSPDPAADGERLADRLADPALLDLLFRLEARRLVRLGPPSGGPTPADLIEVTTALAANGRVPIGTAMEMRQFLDEVHRSLVDAEAWRTESPPWWGPLPEPDTNERLLAALDAALPERVFPSTCPPESGRGWLSIPGLLPADLCRSMHADLEAAFRDGALQFEAGSVGRGAPSSARQDSVHYLTGLETALFPRLAPLATVVQWCLGSLLPRIAGLQPGRALHPPATAMLARYEGPSGGYRAHIDNPGGAADNGRSLAILLYLNDPDRPCIGGELALWRSGASVSSPPDLTVAPVGGTLAVFDSRATPHAVRPLEPGPPRWSLALWLHDEPALPVPLPAIPDLSLADALLPVATPPVPDGRILFHELQGPRPGGEVVVHRAAPDRLRVGIVATVYRAGADLEHWCRHHRDLGFAHLVLVFDRLDEPSEAAAASQLRSSFSDAELTIWSSSELAAQRWERIADELGLGPLLVAAGGGSAPQAVAARQSVNATAALRAAQTDELGGAPLDWLVHLDADELFWLEGDARGGDGLGAHFATLSQAGVGVATYLNHELLLPGRHRPRFKINPRLALARLGSAGWPQLAEHLEATDAHPRPYFSGYRNGKSAVAVPEAAAAAGVHGWRLRDGSGAQTRVLAGPAILHYRFGSADAYCAKSLAMAEAEPGDADLFEMGRADRAAVDVVRAMPDADTAEIRQALLRLRDAVTGFRDREIDLLQEAGLLVEPHVEFGLTVDGAAAPPVVQVAGGERRRRSVGIVGGGTAGYLAALALRRSRPDVDVTVIESTDIPVIGVGEATTPLMPQFLHIDLGLDIREFFRAVRPTFKLGIRFEWGSPGDDGFNYPFGPLDLVDAQRYDGHIENCSLPSMMMSAKVLPVEAGTSGWRSHLDTATAYHLENTRFVDYLSARARVAGVAHVDATVRDTMVTNPARGLQALITEDGRRLTFDTYVDCSGFTSVLMGGGLGSEFTGYEESLFTDRAIVAAMPHGTGPAPHTTAEAMASGWCWSTPQIEADHRGYVFSSAFATEAEAVAEMRARNPTMGGHRTLRFRPGRRRHFRRGNVFALGNAYGFVEPLESTALHMVIRQIGLLLDDLNRGPEHEDALNRQVGAYWDYLAWFLALHYRFNRRRDTPFWRACRADVDVDRHGELLASFLENGPLSGRDGVRFDYPDPLLWGADGIDAILLGQQVATPLAPPSTADRARWAATLRRRRQVVQRSTSHELVLEAIADDPRLLDEFAQNFAGVGPAFANIRHV